MNGNFLTRLLLSCWLLFAGNISAYDASLEYKIKAGYLYNFTKFITWSGFKNPTFNLCILGADPFGAIIDPIEKKTAFERPVKVLRITETDFLANAEPGGKCQILYVGGSANPKGIADMLFKRSHSVDTLIVGDEDGENELDAGEMIKFVNRDGKIKLRVDLQALKRSDLKISAKLLEISELIKDKNHE